MGLSSGIEYFSTVSAPIKMFSLGVYGSNY